MRQGCAKKYKWFPLYDTREKLFLAADASVSFARWQQGEGLWLGWVLCFYCPLGSVQTPQFTDPTAARYWWVQMMIRVIFSYHPLWSLPVPRRARALPVCDVYSQNAFKALLWTSQQYLKHQHVIILPSLTFLAAILDLVLVFWTKMLFSFSQVLVTSSWDNFSPVLVDENRF